MSLTRFAELLSAFEMANFGGANEISAYVSLDTGAIHCTSASTEIDEDVPEDLETSDRYVLLPSKYDLELGNSLALSFVDQELPADYNTVADFFRRKGAYGFFKDLLERRGCLEKWYAFEAKATENALRQWCLENNISLSND